MKTIYRYELRITDEQTVRIPGLIKFLSIDSSRSGHLTSDRIELWALVDTSMPEREHRVWIVGTGNPFPGEIDAGERQHLGHALTSDGMFVWHVWADPDTYRE